MDVNESTAWVETIDGNSSRAVADHINNGPVLHLAHPLETELIFLHVQLVRSIGDHVPAEGPSCKRLKRPPQREFGKEAS